MIEVINTERHHVEALAATMRKEDREEVMASSGSLPLEAIEHSISLSNMSKAIVIDGEVIGIMGVNPVSVIGNVGCFWWLSSDNLDKYKLSFMKLLRDNQKELFGIKDSFGFLMNYVDARYDKSIKWLKWLGFYVSQETIPHGKAGLPFHAVMWWKTAEDALNG